jgi:hypothetical protein
MWVAVAAWHQRASCNEERSLILKPNPNPRSRHRCSGMSLLALVPLCGLALWTYFIPYTRQQAKMRLHQRLYVVQINENMCKTWGGVAEVPVVAVTGYGAAAGQRCLSGLIQTPIHSSAHREDVASIRYLAVGQTDVVNADVCAGGPHTCS